VRRLQFVLLGLVALTACHDDAKPDPTPAPSATVAAAPTPSASATASAAPSASVAAIPTATGTPTSIATATATSTTAAITPSAPAKPVFAHFAGPAFTVDASNPGTCKVGGDCAVSLRFQTTGEYHVNDDYPYRFTATDAPGVTFLGSDGGGTFSRKTGDFQKASATSAVMNVRFRGTAAGTATIAGTFKLAYCTDATCTPATQAVSLSVPIH